MTRVERIDINQGETTVINFTAKRNWVVFDISGHTIYFYVKREIDWAVVITGSGSIVDWPSGTYTVTLSSSTTNITPGKYLYENWLVLGADKYNTGVGELQVKDTLNIPS